MCPKMQQYLHKLAWKWIVEFDQCFAFIWTDSKISDMFEEQIKGHTLKFPFPICYGNNSSVADKGQTERYFCFCSIKMYVDTRSAEVHDAFLSYHNFCFYEVLEKKNKQKKLDHCISSECNALALSVTFKVQWQTCPFGAS